MSSLTDCLYPLINEAKCKLEAWGIVERVALAGESLTSAAKSIASLALAILAGAAVGLTSGEFEYLNRRAISLRNSGLKNIYLSFAAFAGALIHPSLKSFILRVENQQPPEYTDPTVVWVQAYQIMLSQRRSGHSQLPN